MNQTLQDIAGRRFLFTSNKAREYVDNLGIPNGYTPLYALALGYSAGDEPQPTPRRNDCVNYIRR